MTNTTYTTITMEQADEQIENLGLTDQVCDYELNELGHVYFLEDGTTVVIAATTVDQADELVFESGLMEEVEDYEENECGHVYTLSNGTALIVTSPTTYIVR